MIDLEIISHLGKYKIFISKFKFFYIKDFNVRRNIINTIDAFFSKEKDSEFAKENEFTSKLYSDGKLLNVNDFEYYKISDDFDIKSELKLSTKSLFLKYLEMKTQKLEYTENYQTLQYILQDLEEDLQEVLADDISAINFNIHIELEKKQILKLVIPEMIKDTFSANSLDISYDEIIELQLELLLAIAKESKKSLIIILDIPYLKKSWLSLINLFPENNYFLLFNYNVSDDLDPKTLFICNGKIKVDLYDDNIIYDLCMNENKNYTLEEYRTYLVSQLTQK